MTLIVNLFGGPGSGKSTNAAGTYYKLKSENINCEYIQEYAKDKTWQEDEFSLKCQPYITSKQLYRQHRLLGKVDIAITDAPLLNGLIYPGFYTGDHFTSWLVETFNSFNNLNIYLERNLSKHPYNPIGRSQTLQESQDIDIKTKTILETHKIPYHTIKVSDNNPDEIIACIKKVISPSTIVQKKF